MMVINNKKSDQDLQSIFGTPVTIDDLAKTFCKINVNGTDIQEAFSKNRFQIHQGLRK